MDNSNQPLNDNHSTSVGKVPWPLIIFIILALITIAIAWQFTGNKAAPEVVQAPIVEPQTVPEPVAEIVEPELIETPVEKPESIKEEPEPVENPLPSLNESDDWLKIKLPEITWRKELLTLIIDDDMIRRFVVFTDNFAQGTVAYEHSPFVLPKVKFTAQSDTISVDEKQSKDKLFQWNESTSKRFSLYIDLMRSMDSDSLVLWYMEIKPLIDEAYSELGYDDDFTQTLQDAITRVLDMELPKSSMALVQPSVMYKFANPELEALPDTDKLLLRLGKENLLVMKSVLLEIHEKLAQQQNGVNQ